MNENVTSNIFSGIKDATIFQLNFWIKLLAIVFFTDMFLTLSKSEFSNVLSNFTWHTIVTFVVYITITIIILYVAIYILQLVYALGIVKLLEFIDKKSDPQDIAFYSNKYQSDYLSIDTIENYAIINNNQVAYDISVKAKKKNKDRYVMIGVLLLIICDIFIGSFQSILMNLIIDSETHSGVIVIIIAVITISIFRLFYLIERGDRIRIFDDNVRREINRKAN